MIHFLTAAAAAVIGFIAAVIHHERIALKKDVAEARAMAEGAQNAIIQHFQSHPAEDDTEG